MSHSHQSRFMALRGLLNDLNTYKIKGVVPVADDKCCWLLNYASKFGRLREMIKRLSVLDFNMLVLL